MKGKMILPIVLIIFLGLIILVSAETESCIDSDGGWNYYEKGVAKVIDEEGSVTYLSTDHCVGTFLGRNILRETFCSTGGVAGNDHKCLNGCEEGACKLKKGQTCEDSDNGLNYWKRGSVGFRDETGVIKGIGDECLDNVTLKEFYCGENGIVAFELYDCLIDDRGNACFDGSCLSVRLVPTDETGPIEIPEQNSQGYVCVGCKVDNICYPYGYVDEEGRTCLDDFGFTFWQRFIHQLKSFFGKVM